MVERELMKSITQRLEIYKLSGEIEWWTRLNSLNVKTIYGGRVRGNPKGTPDILAIMRNREGNITALFIELKSDTGKLRPEQQSFMDKYNKKQGFKVFEIREPKELDDYIEKYAKDFVSLI